MKLDVTVQLKNVSGEILKDDKGKPAVVRDLLVEALLATFQDEQKLSGEDKLKRWNWAVTIQNNDEVELKLEDAMLLKQLIGKGFGPIIVGQIWPLLEV